MYGTWETVVTKTVESSDEEDEEGEGEDGEERVKKEEVIVHEGYDARKDPFNNPFPQKRSYLAITHLREFVRCVAYSSFDNSLDLLYEMSMKKVMTALEKR